MTPEKEIIKLQKEIMKVNDINLKNAIALSENLNSPDAVKLFTSGLNAGDRMIKHLEERIAVLEGQIK